MYLPMRLWLEDEVMILSSLPGFLKHGDLGMLYEDAATSPFANLS